MCVCVSAVSVSVSVVCIHNFCMGACVRACVKIFFESAQAHVYDIHADVAIRTVQSGTGKDANQFYTR